MLRGAIALVALLLLCTPATAGELDETSPDESQQGQVGLHAKIGTSYRGIFRDGDEFCGKTGEDLCQGRGPLYLDLGAGYRVLEKLELFLEVRVGLERDFGPNATSKGPRTRVYSPGVKVYFKDEGTAKFWSSLMFNIDTTNYYAPYDKTDYGVRLTNAFQFDPHRTFGVFFYAGPIFAWQRWLRFEIEGGIGMQARFP